MKPGESPHPVGAFFTIEAAALQLGRSRQTIHNLLSIHRAHLDPPMYRQLYAPHDRRRYRLLSQRDMDYLCALFPVSYGFKVSRP